LEQLGFLILLIYSESLGQNGWMSCGPYGEFVNSIAIDPKTRGTLYVGTFEGVFKSTYGGRSWALANTGLTDPWVYFLAIDPTTLGTLYTGTVVGGATPLGLPHANKLV
jgi:ligand-binding sensor domain-containing protein